MRSSATYRRLSIYLDDPRLREHIKTAALRRGMTLSAYCLEAIRQRLAADGFLPSSETHTQPRAAAEALDRLRHQIGPIGVRVRKLIEEGRRR
ncbi:MAG: hypothetical protein KatS3mg131_2040 [Candidatus Tectimicrobiota bacterium]|nr:MAG: hypothetical protein KatS3mg131_2040 [Candidatus Tectomicrobia bacterium]